MGSFAEIACLYGIDFDLPSKAWSFRLAGRGGTCEGRLRLEKTDFQQSLRFHEAGGEHSGCDSCERGLAVSTAENRWEGANN